MCPTVSVQFSTGVNDSQHGFTSWGSVYHHWYNPHEPWKSTYKCAEYGTYLTKQQLQSAGLVCPANVYQFAILINFISHVEVILCITQTNMHCY